ncbi:MAG: ergothioneine biosynthesis protein EgtB, partial [Betaproteobacteria bacterium]
PALPRPAPHTASWLERYRDVRARTVALTASLSAEDCALQSMPDASPAKWHLAHTTWFFETFVVAPNDPGYRPFDPAFRVLFNSYYNGIGEQHARAERGLISRPSRDDVLAYRLHVDAAMIARCDQADAEPALAALIELGLNHEQQHQELVVTDVLHLFSRNPARPVLFGERAPTRCPAPAEWIETPAGIAHIGHDARGFAFDNEGPRHRVWLEPFALSSRTVTNGEYEAFIDDDGYRRPELWLSLGWDAVTARGWRAPLYWQRDGTAWRRFGPRGLTDVDPDEPVDHISLFEADAFARWSGARLPTEFEWEVIASRARADSAPAAARHANAATTLLGRCAIAGARSDLGIGDVWEWTSSSYASYPGFRTTPGATGEYNGKFMSSQYVLRGASIATSPGHSRVTYRNFFPPDARWQWSGVRLARDLR